MFPKPFNPLSHGSTPEETQLQRSVREVRAQARRLAVESHELKDAAREACERARVLIEASEELRRQRKR